MKALILLAASFVSLASLAPPAAAEHWNCGPRDGTVVDGLALWLRPGCLGAHAYVPGAICEGVIFHGEVLGVHGYWDLCGIGVWLP